MSFTKIKGVYDISPNREINYCNSLFYINHTINTIFITLITICHFNNCEIFCQNMDFS